MKNKLAFLALLCFVITACTAVARNDTVTAVNFPQPVNTPNSFASAYVDGTLALVNGCLRVDISDGTSYLLIWHPGFANRINNGIVQIIDGKEQVVASVGDYVRISGGGGDISPSNLALLEPLPSDCPGPYWLVGTSITTISKAMEY